MTALLAAVDDLIHVQDCTRTVFGASACPRCGPLHASGCPKTEPHELRWCDGNPWSQAWKQLRAAHRDATTEAEIGLDFSGGSDRRTVVADGTVGMRRGE